MFTYFQDRKYTKMKALLNKPLFTSILAAFCLWAGWPSSPAFPLLFVGMAFFLRTAYVLVEQRASGFRYFGVLYVGLLLWNVLCTWWIYYATLGGVLMAVIANSALMTIPFFCYRLAIKAKVPKLAVFFFLLSWLGFEYIHHNWSLSWPWLTLGNALAKFPGIIQWYEYTGTAGGSFWVLMMAIVLFSIISEFKKIQLGTLAALFVLPMLISVLIESQAKSRLEGNKKKIEVVVLQPNYNTFFLKLDHNKNGSNKKSPAIAGLYIYLKKIVLFITQEFFLLDTSRLTKAAT